MRERRGVYRTFLGRLKGDHLEDPGVGEGIILKWSSRSGIGDGLDCPGSGQ